MFHVQSFQRLFFPFLLFDFIFSCQSIYICFTVQTFTSYVGNHFLYYCKYIKKQKQSNIYSSITNWNNCQIFQSYYRDEHLFISLEAGINHSAKTLFDLYFITSDYLLSNVSKIKCSRHMSREATLTHNVLHYQVTLL